MHIPRIAHSRPALGPIVALVVGVLGFTVLYPTVRPVHADVAVGTSAGDFLGFEVGASSAGLAGANTSVASGASSQFWNPSLLALMSRPQVSIMHATWLGNLQYEWVGYARPIGAKTGVGSLSVTYFHLPNINGFDDFGNPTGEFRAYDMAMTVGFARPIAKGIYLGANGKYIRQTLAAVTLAGAAADLGASATIAGTTFGATVQNLGPNLAYGGGAYPLPMQTRFGMSRSFLANRLMLAADYNIPRTYYKDIRVGAEIRPHPVVAIRVGYRREFGVANDPATGLSYGLGTHVGPINVDYAMTPGNEFTDVHRLSFGYTFGGAESKAEPEKPEPKQPPAVPPSTAPKGPTAIAAAPISPRPQPVAPLEATPTPESKPAPAPAAPKRVATTTSYEVVLGRYQSEANAQSELKALQMLGFSVKDATITFSPETGYRISLARLRSKKSADDLAASLSRLSFSPRVEIVHR